MQLVNRITKHMFADFAFVFLQALYNDTFMVGVKNAGYAMLLVGKIVNNMGPMCQQNNPIIPKGFNIADGDRCAVLCCPGCFLVVDVATSTSLSAVSPRFVAMCNEVVYYGNTFNVDGKLYTTGPSGAANYLQARYC